MSKLLYKMGVFGAWLPLFCLALLGLACAAGPLPEAGATPQPAVPLSGATTTPFQPLESTATPTCLETEMQAMGQSIAAKFELPYEQVLAWNCAGHEFDDILLALQTQKAVPLNVDELLELRAQGLSWDDIWARLGLTQ